MAMNVGKELATLQQMTVRELRERYEQVFGESTRVGNKDFLFKRIAWQLQSLAGGDLSERGRRRVETLACNADLRGPLNALVAHRDCRAPREPLVPHVRSPHRRICPLSNGGGRGLS